MQCRSNDQRVIDILARLNHKEVQRTISIERGVLNKMKGGCHLPLGVFAEERNQEYTVRVSYATAWDQPVRYITFKSDHIEKLADQIVDTLTN